MNNILLLEDDFSLGEILCEFLEEQGFSVTHCVDAGSALDLAYEKKFDLWLLDVKVPEGKDFRIESSAKTKGENLPGFELLSRLREASKGTPCIFITSLSSVEDVAKGYDSGCDDFLKKPFELLELKLRIQTLLKRTFAHKSDDFVDLGGGFRFSILQKILHQNDKIVSLTKKESALLCLLLQNADSYVSVERICEELWEFDEESSQMSLRVYIKNLRKILGKERILNQHNGGYCYVSKL